MENLPVEILHRIFGHLDVETIFFSIRPLCRYFRSITENYDRLNFDLKIVSRCHFDVLCRLISPENIRSLSLYNTDEIPDQISLFRSRVHLQQLTKLQSIRLDGIAGSDLDEFLQSIDVNHLRSFSIHVTQDDRRNRPITRNTLSTIVQQSNLRTVEFRTKNTRISRIQWPFSSSVQCLILYGEIGYENFLRICSCFPQLHRLIIKDALPDFGIAPHLRSSLVQLTSLILDQVNMPMEQLQCFLLLTPSLVYLKIIGWCDKFDGKRWEDFIPRNLPHLTRFEFDIIFLTLMDHETDLFIQSYRSPFWIEDKKWFVTVEYDLANHRLYRIYSNLICQCSYECDFNRKRVSRSTTSEEIFYFPNVTKLHLHFDNQNSINSSEFLPRLLNLSQLTEVGLGIGFLNEVRRDLLCDILKLIQQSSQLSILKILTFFPEKFHPFLQSILPNLPRQIKHLTISIETPKQIPIILERCQQLIVLKLPMEKTGYSGELQEWFEEKTNGSIIRQSDQSHTIWIGNIQGNISSKYKRMKLN